MQRGPKKAAMRWRRESLLRGWDETLAVSRNRSIISPHSIHPLKQDLLIDQNGLAGSSLLPT